MLLPLHLTAKVISTILLCLLINNLKAQPTITANAQPITITLGSDGSKTMVLADIATVTSDITAKPMISISPTVFSCADIGNQVVTVTARDQNGTSTLQIPVKVNNGFTIIYSKDKFEVPVYGSCISSVPDFSQIYKADNSCNSNVFFTQSVYAGSYLGRGQIINVTLTIKDKFGNVSSNVVQVTGVDAPVPLPSLTITASDTKICNGQTVSFIANITRDPGFGFQLQWMINDSPVSNAKLTTFKSANLQDGDRVSCTIIGACSDEVIPSQNTITMQVDPTAVKTATISDSNNDSCLGQNISFTLNNSSISPNQQYQWRVNDVAISEQETTFSSNSLHNGDKVTCVVTNSQSLCVANREVVSNEILVRIHSAVPPTISITPIDPSTCEGEPFKFVATVNNQGSNPLYQWQVNGQNQGGNSLFFSLNNPQNGDVVICVLKSSENCLTPAKSQNSTVKTNPLPNVIFNQNPVIIKDGESVQLHPLILGSVIKYEWNPSIGLTNSNSPEPFASPLKTTIYTLDVISEFGCQVSKSITVTVVNDLKIPNTFTPNGDGINDTWTIDGLTNYSNCSVEIFNRYGQKIYFSTNYLKPWDGKLNNQTLPIGVYYYIIKLMKTSKPIAGYVTLLR